jgi:hypothetical protein
MVTEFSKELAHRQNVVTLNMWILNNAAVKTYKLALYI